MASVSGLSLAHRIKARQLAVDAAMLAVHHEPAVHYSQGANRWQGLDEGRKASQGQYPTVADCSSFTTWCIWNGLRLYTLVDTVNASKWRYGFTGTQRQHGKRVRLRMNWRKGDLVHYGPGTGRHVAIVVDPLRGLVASHGSEGGPKVVAWNYRGDFAEVRRYI